MDTSRLKKFAQYARRSLIEQVESKLKLVLAEESEASREYPKAVADLQKKLTEQGQEQLIEQVGYTWFNRFCALRFMDVNQYNRIMVISPLAGQFQPEVLAEAKAGHIDENVVSEATREKVFGLLSGSVASRDGQSEAFRQLIVAVCNDLHRIMPYLFERIEDYTELLMPDDLLSGNSILAYTREAMTPEACESVESIGWLYQFYISEKKDEVFDGLKKNKKITPENIPAATQLFTPHWIVRYLVENSLGRLWMLNNPNSKVIEQMDYYIQPVEEEKNFLKISSPEEIKVCDPACGSGHMLTYAYDLLYIIYSSTGDYDDAEIPSLILTNNLYGIEIDERAAELAAFALTMKAIKGGPNSDGSNRRRFFRNPVEPNICRLEKVVLTDEELNSYIDFVGKDLFTQDLRATLKEFEKADNFGSLIQPTLKTSADTLATLESKDVSGQLFLTETHKSVLKVLKQADYLQQKYHVVVANPPYMGSKGFDFDLLSWSKEKYPECWDRGVSDLYALFIERISSLVYQSGYMSMITMQGWMFASSYSLLRKKLFGKMTLRSMAHLGARAFDSIPGQVVTTTSFVFLNNFNAQLNGDYIKLTDGGNELEKEKLLESAIRNGTNLYSSNAETFKKIPGSPVAYWATKKQIDVYLNHELITDYASFKAGLSTGDNHKFQRQWYEVSQDQSIYGASSASEVGSLKWVPCNSGGKYRRWYGNNDVVVNWAREGNEVKSFKGSAVRNEDDYFKAGLTYNKISSGKFACRYKEKGFIFDDTGRSISVSNEDLELIQGYLLSSVAGCYLNILVPTLSFTSNELSNLPFIKNLSFDKTVVTELIKLSRDDWNSMELSWEFSRSVLLPIESISNRISDAVSNHIASSLRIVDLMVALENKNNNFFEENFGLKGDLPSGVCEFDITLINNPYFQYGDNKSEQLLKELQTRDLVIDFLSFSVGCMFGRYSLDKDGLILANQGDTLVEYLSQIPKSSFMPDDDNVIPLIDFDGDWFEDDITERFKQFLKVTFGEEHFSENLAFIEETIGKDIKKFFLKDFYKDHVTRYTKRPIYWMFSSPKGSFNALIYMHRYNKDTVSIVLNDYLREFRTKLQARKESYEQVEISVSASPNEKTQAINFIRKINIVLDDVNDYERDILYPLAAKAPEIDLDDGVKHNYPLFGKALKKITGLS
ncbi:type II restriction endonuclease [Marinomonas primoryensis]|uniref:site-specific DNA-methyltransferase (adenine-specific) n=1 Tax=Marinomonas primoryensis TaxID=178399 RepID=A0A2Z4PU28_9GAMM|nr:BREX-1 system adenine-specific DNA-methyltransferase PglX [Marinomonas primoryensis]AWY01111.1 type II restriction endonuclease [Marinomonas primoryensis]